MRDWRQKALKLWRTGFFRDRDRSLLKKYDLGPELGHLIKRTNLSERDLDLQQTNLSELRWPFFRNQAFDNALQNYMFSFKNIYSPGINTGNSLFLIGPTKSGKSWFLRSNLRKFKDLEIKPLVFHYDLRRQQSVNFPMFLHSFEKMIVDTLVEKNQQMQANEQVLISDAELLGVVLEFSDRMLVEHQIAQGLKAATGPSGVTFGYSLG